VISHFLGGKMSGKIQQEINGDGNIQVGRDLILKIFKIRKNGGGGIGRIMDGYLAFFYILLIAFLLATTLPNSFINILASLGTIGTLGIIGLLHFERRRLLGAPPRRFRKFQGAVAALVIMSVLTGCAGPLFGKNGKMARACSDVEGKPCRYGVAQGVGIFGFGLDQVTLRNAVEAGHLNKVISSSEVRGYGLISMARVTVYGE
jgi:hypothetical protein